MTEDERYECVRHCKWADEVLEDAPGIVTPEYMTKHGIDFVSHGEDLSVDEFGNDVYQHIKDMKRFLTIKRTEGISTTDLIMRIVRDYEQYVRRNLLRGYSRQEMNVGIIKAQQIKISNKVDQYVAKWKNVSEKLIHDFARVFTQPPTRRLNSSSQEEEDHGVMLSLSEIEDAMIVPMSPSSPSFDAGGENYAGSNNRNGGNGPRSGSILPGLVFIALTASIFKFGQDYSA